MQTVEQHPHAVQNGQHHGWLHFKIFLLSKKDCVICLTLVGRNAISCGVGEPKNPLNKQADRLDSIPENYFTKLPDLEVIPGRLLLPWI